MTALTPEQMCALASQLRSNADAHQEPGGTERRRAAAALRAAADQLEAVRQVVVDNSFQAFDGEVAVYSDLVTEIVFPADTAPQEDRND